MGRPAGMGRAAASIAAGVTVGLITSVAAWFLLMAATWSSIHGGMSELVLVGLSLLAMVVPVGSGFMAGFLVLRATAQRQRHQGMSKMPDPPPRMVSVEPLPSTPSPRLNCPYCGCTMTRPADYADTPPYQVMECPIHGPFYFGPSTALTLGRPRNI
jgi:hypothetical protein